MVPPATLEAPPPEITLLPPHRWSRQEYEDLIASGMIEEGSRVELIEGVITDMPVQKPKHSVAGELAQQALASAFGPSCHVRSQRPLSLDEFSAPEPDVAVVKGGVRDYLKQHPATALLVVEISDTTLAKDRGPKLRVYARNQIAEYWIVNLAERQLEVHRDPAGDGYRSRAVLAAGESVSPLAAPAAKVAVADLLP